MSFLLVVRSGFLVLRESAFGSVWSLLKVQRLASTDAVLCEPGRLGSPAVALACQPLNSANAAISLCVSLRLNPH